MIDKNGKLFGLVNVIDLLIVVVVVAVLGAGIYKFGIQPASNDEAVIEDSEVHMVVKCRVQPEEAARQLAVGQKLVAKNAFQTAEIIDIKVEPAMWVAWTAEGKAVNTVHPIWKDITVTIKDSASENSPVVRIGGQEARCGKEYILKTNTFELPGIVYDIEFQ